MAVVFFSYSHIDETLRDQLEQHLSLLKRQGLVETWHDRRIVAGNELDPAISENLEHADIILLLVSSSFIGSEYCYSREMNRALERHEARAAKVIPVILRPCDWQSAPFGKILAIPRDGKAVTMWANADEAFTDIAKQIRAAVEDVNIRHDAESRADTNIPRPTAVPSKQDTVVAKMLAPVTRSSNLRLSKQFTDLECDEFLHSAFEYLGKFFETSLFELGQRNPGIRGRFQSVDARKFTAIIYREGKSTAECTIRIDNMGGRSPCLSFSYSASAPNNTSNEMLHIEHDSQSIFFRPLGMQSYKGTESRLSEQGAAEYFWDLFIAPLQR